MAILFLGVAQFGWLAPRDYERMRSGVSRTITYIQTKFNLIFIGVWLSLVERCVRDAEVACSNPVTPTISDTAIDTIVPVAVSLFCAVKALSHKH